MCSDLCHKTIVMLFVSFVLLSSSPTLITTRLQVQIHKFREVIVELCSGRWRFLALLLSNHARFNCPNIQKWYNMNAF